MNNNFCVLDIETTGLSARPESFVLGCIYANDGLLKKSFTDRLEMIKYIFNQDEFKYVFAHNAEYDFTGLFDNIFQNLDKEALFVGSMFVKGIKDKMIFMNSLAVLKTSVSELGKHYGLQKLELNEKFKNAKPGDKIEITKEDIEYCLRDCEIVYDYLVEIFDITGKMKPTIASCAMEIFVKKYLYRKLELNPVNEIFRESYYGGRVECFRFGKIKKIFKYDINSLYPYVCTKMYFPDFNKLKKGKDNSLIKFTDILNNYEGCAYVEIDHKDNFVGTLPFRTKTEIIYPCGNFSGYYNFNELRKSYSTGLIKIKKVQEYFYAPKIFFNELSDYMKFFYEKKNTTEGSQKLIFKFILNALTGKFAQREHGKKRYCENLEEAMKFIHDKNLELGEHCRLIHFNEEREDMFVEYNKSEKQKISTFSKWNIPTISSYITSQARIEMIDFYLKYKDQLIYTDTDSLILTCPIEDKYIGDKLGMFKHENDEEIEIIGNKHYYTKIGDKEFKYIKGVHKNHTVKNGRFYFDRMIRTKEGLRRVDELTGTFITVEKNLTGNYSKRKKTGLKTQPLVMFNNVVID